MPRARILSISPDGLLKVFYVDYGDKAIVTRDQARRLREDFASEIPFQAVECLIAHIKPPPPIRSSAPPDVKEDHAPPCGTAATNSVDDEIHSFMNAVLDDVENSEQRPEDIPEDVWTDEALDFVDEVTHNANWVILYAKIVDYSTNHSTGKTVPTIELADTNGDCEVDIASSIVQAGHAVWCDEN